MKQYQLYVRKHECDQWSYGDTFTEADIAWAGMMLSRHRGFQTRMVTTQATIVPRSGDQAHG